MMTVNKDTHILIVDDEASQRDLFEMVLSEEGYSVETASSGEEAVQKVEDRFYNLVIMDMKMGGMGGLEALKRIKEISAAVQVLIVTAYASVDTAVDAMRSGALNYLTKPIDLDELKVQVEKTMQFSHLVAENESLKAQVAGAFEASQIIGNSPRIQEIFEEPDRRVVEFIERHGRVCRALDLGCATGRSVFELARFCDHVTGIDFSTST